MHRAFDTAGALIGVLLSALLLWWLTGTPQQTAGVPENLLETPGWVYRVIFGIGAVRGLGSFFLTFFVRESDSSDVKTPAARTGLFTLPGSYWSVLGVLVLFSLANSIKTFLLLRRLV